MSSHQVGPTRDRPHRYPVQGRPTLAATVAAAAASVLVLGSFLPWARSGTAERSSYELVTSVRRLELLDGIAADLAPVWFLVPALVGGAWLALALGRPRAAATLSGLVGLLGAALVLQTARSPLVHLSGATLSGWAGAIAIVAALAGWLPRRDQRDRPQRPRL